MQSQSFAFRHQSHWAFHIHFIIAAVSLMHSQPARWVQGPCTGVTEISKCWWGSCSVLIQIHVIPNIQMGQKQPKKIIKHNWWCTAWPSTLFERNIVELSSSQNYWPSSLETAVWLLWSVLLLILPTNYQCIQHLKVDLTSRSTSHRKAEGGSMTMITPSNAV